MSPSDITLNVDISSQTLTLKSDKVCTFPVSTALAGACQTMGSMGTPLGKHYVRAKIGQDQPINAVFIARRPTGEIYSETLAKDHPDRDWILTRILWLCGQECGINRGGNVDSMRRFIYIHGTPDSEPMGKPFSHGCIRMRNTDIVTLFDQVKPGTSVIIRP